MNNQFDLKEKTPGQGLDKILVVNHFSYNAMNKVLNFNAQGAMKTKDGVVYGDGNRIGHGGNITEVEANDPLLQEIFALINKFIAKHKAGETATIKKLNGQ